MLWFIPYFFYFVNTVKELKNQNLIEFNLVLKIGLWIIFLLIH